LPLVDATLKRITSGGSVEEIYSHLFEWDVWDKGTSPMLTVTILPEANAERKATDVSD
jgi:hypothetical protein